MELRENIQKAAYELFATIGFERTTIQAIIKTVGCSKGGFYHHFESKDEILDEITNAEIKSLADHFGKIVIGGDDFTSQFNAIYVFTMSYKISQLKDMDKINNIFKFSGNDRILRRINEQFKETVYNAYLALLRHSIKKKEIEFPFIKQVSQLCARQILWLIEEIRSAATSGDEQSLKKTLVFSEKLIAQNLGVSNDKITYEAESIRYLESIKLSYKDHKESRK